MNPLLIRRRGMMVAKASYRRVEYVLFNGGYFHLNYYPTEGTQIDANLKNVSTDNQYLWNSGTATPRVSCFLSIVSSGGNIRFGNKAVVVHGSNLNSNSITLQHNQTHFKYGSTTKAYTAQSPFTAIGMLYFGDSQYPFQGGFRFIQVSENGNLLFDLLPVERNDGVVGYLDQVNGVFYQSETSTPFTAGPYI